MPSTKGDTLTKQELQKSRHELAEAVREYSRSQLDAWRQIPWFALQSEGRTGWSSGHEYKMGIRVLRSLDAHGYHIGGVDLETGDLIHCPQNHKDIRQLGDDHVLKTEIDELDAADILAMFVRSSCAATGCYYDENQQLRRRDQLAAYYGLSVGEPYVRKTSFVVREDYMG